MNNQRYPERRRPAIIWLLACAVLLPLSNAACRAADSPLLQLVGEDAGLIVRARNMREEVPKLWQGPIGERIRSLPLFHDWKASSDHNKLQQSRAGIEALIGQPVEEFLGDLFGEDALLAVFPRPGERAHAVLLTQAAAEDSLVRTIGLWNRAERTRVEPIAFANGEYFRRERLSAGRDVMQTVYYVRFGRILAISDSEPLIQQAVALKGQGTAPDAIPRLRGIERLEAFRAAAEAMEPADTISLYVNPRAWDGVLKVKTTGGPADLLPALIWKRCRWLAGGLRTSESGLHSHWTIGLDQDSLPPNLAQLKQTAKQPAALSTSIPPTAVASAAGQCDFAALARLFENVLPANRKDEFDRSRRIARGALLGHDPLDAILPGIASHWSGFLAEIDQQQTAMPPIGGALLLEWNQAAISKTDGASNIATAVDNAATSLLNYAAGAQNEDAARPAAILRIEKVAGETLRWVDGLQPFPVACCVTGRGLYLSTHPQLIRAALNAAPSSRPAPSNAWAGDLKAHAPKAGHVVILRTEQLRRVLAGHFGIPAPEGALDLRDAKLSRQQKGALSLLNLADALSAGLTVDDQSIRLSVGVTVEPAR